MSARRRSLGLSLIEVVVFIIVLGVGFAGILILYNQTTRASVDPVVRKQAVAIATSLMEEIQLRGFTFCDPDDANVYTATSTAGCATTIEVVGTEGGETRYGPTFYDNVSDYQPFTMLGGIQDITNFTIPGLGAYSASVSVQEIVAGELGADVTTLPDALRITVAVAGPGSVNVSLQGYRLRYAPNTP